MIKFNRVRVPSIVKFLRKICRSEGISAEDDALRVIAERCEGDVRSAVNDLQFYAEGKERLTLDEVVSLDKRDRELNVFDTLRSIFSARDCDGVKDAIKRSEVPLVSASKTDLLLTLSENLPLHYSSLEEMAKAYDALSKADVVLGRIKRTQSWKLLDHLLKILATGLAFTKREVAHRRFIFPPMKVIMLSERKHEKRLLDEVCSRIGSKLHISRRVAQIEVLPFVKILMDGPLSHSIITWLNLEKEHVRYLRIAPR
jgi:replication factor C large subunit